MVCPRLRGGESTSTNRAWPLASGASQSIVLTVPRSQRAQVIVSRVSGRASARSAPLESQIGDEQLAFRSQTSGDVPSFA